MTLFYVVMAGVYCRTMIRSLEEALVERMGCASSEQQRTAGAASDWGRGGLSVFRRRAARLSTTAGHRRVRCKAGGRQEAAAEEVRATSDNKGRATSSK